jgi:hypothetical protein
MEKINRLIFSYLLAAIVLTVGCVGFVHHSDPLAGWHVSDLINLDSNKAISDDYRAYISKLSPNEKKYLAQVFYFEDGTDQHAVRISILLNGTGWAHILIYDKENKRIRVIKYAASRYMS